MGSFNNFNNGMNSQQGSTLYPSIPQYFYQNPLYPSSQGTYWASFGGSPSYLVDPVIGQMGGYQQQYVPYGSSVYQQPHNYGYQQLNYQSQYQPQYYQPFNQQYVPQVTYAQMNPYQGQSYQGIQQQQQYQQPSQQQQSYQQSSYSQQPSSSSSPSSSAIQNNLRGNDMNVNYQNSYQNL